MKFLEVFFLVGLTLANAIPVPEYDIKEVRSIERSLSELTSYADDNMKTELGKKLKERFDEVFDKVTEAIDNGKVIKEEYIEKLKEIRDLKSLQIRLKKRERDLVERLKEKTRDLWKKILDRFGNKDESELFFADNADTHTELIKKLRELLDQIRNKIKEDIESGKGVNQEITDKLLELREKLRDMIEKERRLRNKDGLLFVDDGMEKRDIRDVFRKLRDLIKSKVDSEALKKRVEELFGKGSEIAEQLINMLKEKGDQKKQKILDWIDRVLGDKEEKRSVSDVFEKIKNYFKELNIELKERFSKFGQWVKDQYSKGLEKGKDKMENIKKIAKEFINDSKQVSKEIAREALDFFNDYKKDLGIVFDDVVEKVKKVLKENQ